MAETVNNRNVSGGVKTWIKQSLLIASLGVVSGGLIAQVSNEQINNSQTVSNEHSDEQKLVTAAPKTKEILRIKETAGGGETPEAETNRSVLKVIDAGTTVSENMENSKNIKLPARPKKLVARSQTVAKIVKGGSAAEALARLGLRSADINQIVRRSHKFVNLSRVKPGEVFKRKGKSISYNVNSRKRLVAIKNNGEWKVKIEKRKITNHISALSARLNNSLFYDGNKAGIEDGALVALTEIFAWDIDFGKDIKKGAEVSVVVNKQSDDEGKVVGEIVEAARIVNNGKKYEAFRYVDKKGRAAYYTPNGASMKKAFLRSPVKYTRISSRFNAKRKHPILGYTRAHKGVDYAAPIGTPVRAVASGTVIYKGRHGGHGNFVQIKHRNGYVTGYAHLSRYGKIRKWSKVEQGQIIAYVGSTGLSTGPHLHFEVKIGRKFLNPLKIKHISGSSVKKKEMARFKKQTAAMIAQLDQTIVAMNNKHN